MDHSDIEVLSIGGRFKLRAWFHDHTMGQLHKVKAVFEGTIIGNNSIEKVLKLGQVFIDGHPLTSKYALDYDSIIEDLTEGLDMDQHEPISELVIQDKTPLPPLPVILERMYHLAVWDNLGHQYLPIFDYEWLEVTNYMPAEEAIPHNVQLWYRDERTSNE